VLLAPHLLYLNLISAGQGQGIITCLNLPCLLLMEVVFMIKVPRPPCPHGAASVSRCRVCDADWRKRYRAANLEEYRQRNRENRKVYYQNNRTLVILDSMNRRAKSYGVEGVITVEYYNSVINNPCLYCGQSGLPMELDHRIPMSKGGSNLPENVNAVCQFCNKAKHFYGEEEFLIWLEGLRQGA
jgi:5-methylcytosine-specific restriction endonuclease McrA